MNYKIYLLFVCSWVSHLSCMHTVIQHNAKTRKAIQQRGVLSYNPNVYLGKAKRDHIHHERIKLGTIVEEAHALMLEPIKKDRYKQEIVYKLPHMVLRNALSVGESEHDHHNAWLWPSEIEPLMLILYNSRATIHSVNDEGIIIDTFHSWNFPLHTLRATLKHFRYDAIDIDDTKELSNAYTKLIKDVETLCDKRFEKTQELFNTKTAIQACKEYHIHIAQLKKLDE